VKTKEFVVRRVAVGILILERMLQHTCNECMSCDAWTWR